jgi:hypothetical protein
MGEGTPMEDVMVPEHGNGERTIGFHNGGEFRVSADFCQAKNFILPGFINPNAYHGGAGGEKSQFN